MRFLRYFIAAVLVFGVLGVTGVAHAFTFGVLDPQTPNPYPVEPGVSFPVQFFNDCPTVLGGPDSGCFFAINNSTTVTLTSLEITFVDNGPGGTNGQEVSCDSSPFFNQSSCTLANGVYTMDFSGGTGIGPGVQFALVEDCDVNGDCVPPADFPIGSAIANAPEPGSIWLALSGLGPLGYLVRRRRRANDC